MMTTTTGRRTQPAEIEEMVTMTSDSGLISDQARELRQLVKGADSIELKLTLPEQFIPFGGGRPGCRSAGRPDPPGVLLRHPRPRSQPGRGGRPGSAGAGSWRRLGGQAATSGPRRAAGDAAEAARVRRRGGRPAWRLRLLGVAQGVSRERRSASTVSGRARCARCSRRTSGRSSPNMPRRVSPSTTWTCSARSSCSSSRSSPKTFDRRIVAEMWLYPDGTRIVELSTKCLPGEGLDVVRAAA